MWALKTWSFAGLSASVDQTFLYNIMMIDETHLIIAKLLFAIIYLYLKHFHFAGFLFKRLSNLREVGLKKEKMNTNAVIKR